MRPRPDPSSLPRSTLRTLVLGVAASAGALAPAATLTWQNNATSSTWSFAGNWGGTAPTDGDDLVFSSASGALAFQPSANDLVDLRLRSLAFLNSTFNSAITLGGERILLDGTLGATNTLSTANTAFGRTVTIGNQLELVGTQTWTTANNANSRFILNGSITGDATVTLTGRAGSAPEIPQNRNTNFNFSVAVGETNTGFTGVVVISSQVLFSGSDAAYFSGAEAVHVIGLGQVTFDYSLTNAPLANLRLAYGADLLVSGSSGSVASLDIGVVFSGTGANLVLDNYQTLQTDRFGNSQTLALDGFGLHLIGNSSTTGSTLNAETIGAITFAGGSRINITPRSASSSKIALLADSLTASAPSATIALNTTHWDDGNGLFLSQAPTLTHGILDPGVIVTNTSDFTTLRTVSTGPYAGRHQTIAFSGYTTYANPTTWAPASSTEISRITFDSAATGDASLTADTEVYALKLEALSLSTTRGLDLAGHTLTIGGGGLIMTRSGSTSAVIHGTTAGSELAFGASTAKVYVVSNALNNFASISAPISGTGGLVKSGPGGLELLGVNTFTGGVYIHEGTLRLGAADSLNQQVVTVGPAGVFAVLSTPTTNILAGLAGSGEVRNSQILRIDAATGQTHTFSGNLYNGGGTLSLEKSGDGTQIFSGTRAADANGSTSTGFTEVYAGTLVVDGDWSATTGDFDAYFGTTLSGGGAIGGTAFVEGTLAPGYQSTRGDLRFLGDLTLTNDTALELDLDSGATRGTTYDAITVGGLLGLDGSLFLNLTSAAAAATQSYQIYDFGSLAGQFDQVTITGAFSTQLTRFDEVWTGESGGHSFSFDSSIGQVVIAPVPEPATCAALACFGSLAFACLRRRPRA